MYTARLTQSLFVTHWHCTGRYIPTDNMPDADHVTLFMRIYVHIIALALTHQPVGSVRAGAP